ncbi:DnaJ domain-containing protein [Candidatus Omnitrophota bacterium]
MSKRDYYGILGIDRNADETTVKRVYRNLAMKYHPDRNPGDNQASDMMKEVNEAYAVLSDIRKRQLYDTYGHAGLEGYTQEDIFRGVDFSDLFHEFGLSDLFGFGDDIFSSFFSRRTASRGPRKGADLRYNLSLTLEEVAFGTEKIVQLPKVERCPVCGGTGAKSGSMEHCENCKGTGQIIREQRSGYGVFRQIKVCSKCQGKGEFVKQPCQECEGEGVIEKIKEIALKIPADADTGYNIKVVG